MKILRRYLLPLSTMVSSSLLLANENEKQSKGIAKMADSITEQLKSIASLIVALAYVAGLGFLLAGLFKFKQHKDNPTQVPIGTPIVLVALGCGMLFLPGLVQAGGETVGIEKSDGGASGFAFNPAGSGGDDAEQEE